MLNHRNLIAILLSVCGLWSLAADFSDESLTYKVQYKWGLVQKVAGNVTINLNNRNDKYICNLYAASAPWADSFFKVRDTLQCEIVRDGFIPLVYRKRAHEGDTRSLDVVRYEYTGGKILGHCSRKSWKDGKIKKDETRELEAIGQTVDMMSAFYYMRSLPYSTWTKNTTKTINIFSGKKKELLVIKYVNRETIKYDDKTYDCYHIKFKFTSDEGKKSSDDIDAWITTGGRHIPVKLEGSLPVGKIRCFYTGN